MLKHKSTILSLFMLVMILGCSRSSKQFFDTSRTSYDPFTINNNSSALVLPPVYYLTAEELYNERKNIQRESDRIQRLLFGDPISSQGMKNGNHTHLSTADKIFLKLAKADQDNSSVRKKLDLKYNNVVVKDEKFIKKLSSKGKHLHEKRDKDTAINNK